MPQRRPDRLLPGQSATAGHKLDLGAILGAAFGGVAANPDFNPDEADIADFTGIAGKGNPNDFYKAKSFMDKGRVGELNAAFKQQQFQQAQDDEEKRKFLDYTTQNELSRASALGPISATNAGLLNDKSLEYQTALEKLHNFSSAGLLDPGNIPQAAEMTRQPNLEGIAAAIHQRAIANGLGVNQAKQAYEINDVTAPTLKNTAISDALAALGLSQGKLQAVPAINRNQLLQEQEAPYYRALGAKEKSIIATRPGETLYNAATGKPEINVPEKPVDALKAKIMGQALSGQPLNVSPQGQVPQPNPPNNIPAANAIPSKPEEIDPSKLISIGGKLYIRH